MKAHVVHDGQGAIKSVVLESADVDGSLEISSDDSGDEVTTVDVDDAPADASADELFSLAERIRKDFRVDKERGALKKLRD